jgi:acetyl esterase/lipase
MHGPLPPLHPDRAYPVRQRAGAGRSGTQGRGRPSARHSGGDKFIFSLAMLPNKPAHPAAGRTRRPLRPPRGRGVLPFLAPAHGRLRTACLRALALLGWLFASPDSSAQQNPVPLPKTKHGLVVIAHRGNHEVYPENTLAAVEAAIRSGVDYVEVDLRTTRDGQLVLCHDETVDRTTHGKGKVKDLRWEELSTLTSRGKDGKHYPIPLFADVLKACKDRVNIYLDFKDADVGATHALIRSLGMERQVMVYLNSIPQYLAWRKTAPLMPLMTSLPGSVATRDDLAAVLDRMSLEALDNVRDTAMLRAAMSFGMHVWLDVQGTDEGPAKWKAALDKGVQGLQTDHPDALIRYLNENNLRSGSTVSAVTFRKTADPGYRKMPNVAYAKDSEEQVMDVYFPKQYADAKVILYMHGGSWVSGDKGEFPSSLVEELAGKRNYIVVSMNYRLIRDGKNRFPSQMEDVTKAMRFLTKAARRFKFNRHEFALMGGSAGGQMAMLYAYGYDRRRQVKAVVDLWGPTDFTDSSVRGPGTEQERICYNLLGDHDPNAAISREASPFHRATRETAVPTLIIHGGDDMLVPVTQADKMHKKLQALGVPVQYDMYAGEKHGISSAVRAEVFGKVVDWLDRHFPAR